MKRHRISAFSTAILAMVMAVAGLVSTTPAQAQTYGPGGINPQENIAIRVVGRQVEVTTSSRGTYYGTLTVDIPAEGQPGVYSSTTYSCPSSGDSQTPWYTQVSYSHYIIHHPSGYWDLNRSGGGPPPNASPTVSITAPTGGATYTAPATVNITASASDTDGTIAKVEFYQGATKLGEDTDSSGGWTYSWTGVAAGAYSLTAKAFDNGGASTISAAVGITVNQPATPTIANDAASGLTAGSATLNGNLTSTGTASTTVFVYWGTVDLGQTTSGWGGSQNLGTRSPGAVSHSISGLAQGTYYYRFYASNSAGVAWADPAASFRTLSAPVVDNDGGATNITAGGARLRGTLTAGGSAAVTIYWGTVDGVTNPSAWQHTNSLGTASEGAFFSDLSGLDPSTTYRYRCYAENVVGTDWADATATFQTPERTDYRMKITFSGYTNRTEALTNFPALVVFDTNLTNFAYAQFLSTNGYDLRFRDAGDTVELNYEIEQWNIGGSSYVWVQVPLIRTNSDYIWASWGDPGATNRPACTTNGATWDATFAGVWHMKEPNAKDSTSKGLNATASGNTSTSGMIGSGQNFAQGQYAYVSDTPDNPLLDVPKLTISLWMKAPAAQGQTYSRMVDRNAVGAFAVGRNNNNSTAALWCKGSEADTQGNVFDDTWHHVAFTFNGSTTAAYRDGVLGGTGDPSDGDIPAQTDIRLTFGANYGAPSGYQEYYSGVLDEVRLSSVARSSNWVWATYMSMAANTAFNTYGPVFLFNSSGPSGETVTFNANGGSGTMSPQSSSVAANLTANTFTRSGYAFAGWNTVAGGGGTAYADGASYSFAASITLYAQWTPVPTYTVTYDANGATSGTAPGSQTKTHDVTLTLAANSGNLAKTGYTFAGWNTAANGSGTDYAAGGSYTANAAVTLYAKWTALTYTVSYNANGATSGTAPGSQTKTHDVTLTLAANSGNLAKTGYTFAGWNTAADGSGTDYAAGGSYTANAAVTLYAKWTAVPTCTVTFNANSGSGTMSPQTSPVNVAANLTLNTFTRTGYAFAGWNTVAGGGGTAYADGASYTFAASITLYAQWTPVPTYTVTYDANGATSGTAPGSQTKTENISLTLANNSGNLARTGYAFAGWNTAANGSGTDYAAGGSYTANAAVTLYAKWTAVPTYTVTYNANGATSGTAPASQTKTNGISLTLASNSGNLARTGYTFAGWNTAAAGSGTSYAAGASYTADAAVTLYAKWNDDRAVQATGGTVTTSGGYTIHTFTSDGTFAVTTGGTVEYLVVGGGGGGGGGGSTYACGGGGGGGGVLSGTGFAVTPQAYSITVGAGGAGGAIYVSGSSGGDSSFSTLTAKGGSYGSGWAGPQTASGGGCGGGGGGVEGNGTGTGSSGTTGQGYGGGNRNPTDFFAGSQMASGGGGGAGGAGANATDHENAGGGGIGLQSSISGAAVTYAGGGGGGGFNTGGSGGSGVGGNGASGQANGSSAGANTGGGGGGSGAVSSGGGTTGGSGGSGIVIVRYLTVGGSIADADGDGMDDDWENTHLGGTNTSSGTAGEDYDGDGFRDLFEFYAGTDPTNAASLLKVVQVSPDAASNFVLDWPSVAGKVYSVKRIADMMTPPWQTVASDIAATPPMNVYTVSVTGVESGFYRVEVQP